MIYLPDGSPASPVQPVKMEGIVCGIQWRSEDGQREGFDKVIAPNPGAAVAILTRARGQGLGLALDLPGHGTTLFPPDMCVEWVVECQYPDVDGFRTVLMATVSDEHTAKMMRSLNGGGDLPYEVIDNWPAITIPRLFKVAWSGTSHPIVRNILVCSLTVGRAQGFVARMFGKINQPMFVTVHGLGPDGDKSFASDAMVSAETAEMFPETVRHIKFRTVEAGEEGEDQDALVGGEDLEDAITDLGALAGPLWAHRVVRTVPKGAKA
tara:strand:+ start:722 stop:1519 length:798 start_codon:yes stop_codon:yes gene_type:complete